MKIGDRVLVNATVLGTDAYGIMLGINAGGADIRECFVPAEEIHPLSYDVKTVECFRGETQAARKAERAAADELIVLRKELEQAKAERDAANAQACAVVASRNSWESLARILWGMK